MYTQCFRQFVKLPSTSRKSDQADPRKSAFFVQALTCVERVPNIAVYRENNLVCEAVDYVKVVSAFETN